MRYIFALLTISLLIGCSKKEEEIDMEYQYYPIVKGNFIVYKVLEINTDINSSVAHDTLNYYIKAKIGDTIIDNEGRIANRYERYTSTSAAGPWTIQDVWTTIKDQYRAELVEENNRTIKLVFKPTLDKEWNTNTYNILDPLNCYYTDLNQSLTINGLSFNETLVVEQEDEYNYIEFKRKYEKYAKGVGMIYKYYRDLEIIGGNPGNVKKGKELFMEIVQYGHE